MPEYYVNKKPDKDGFHEVHHIICPHLSEVDLDAFVYLGRFNSCHKALAEAKKHFTQADGCRRCASSCHTDRKELLLLGSARSSSP